jgi:hypothetical protein
MKFRTIQKIGIFTTLGLMPLFALADFATWTNTTSGSVGGISFSLVDGGSKRIVTTTTAYPYDITQDPNLFSPTMPLGTPLLHYRIASNVSVEFSRASTIYLNLVYFGNDISRKCLICLMQDNCTIHHLF